MPLTTPQVAECFHLAFLSVLPREMGAANFVLKGGANLRYYFGSDRYSEDIDLDVVRLKAWQVKEKVDRVLGSQQLAILLRAQGLRVEEFSAPKQTETTQRWKVAVGPDGLADPIRTKIELSHRQVDPRFELAPVPRHAVSPYALRPPTVQHYQLEAAVEQKVSALAGRSQTQARDVFDLDLLFRKSDSIGWGPQGEERELAAQRALELPFEAYRDQVLPFLEPEVADLVEDRTSWEQMQMLVVERLEATDGDR